MNSRTFIFPLLGFLVACVEITLVQRSVHPVNKETAKTKALEAGADLMQDKTPIRTLNAYMDGFHFYNGDLKSQMEAHHYCGHLNEEVIQCVIFDGNQESAKLMGVEYIVSRAMFGNFPAEEKRLWHSHMHEVRSSQLIAPGIPGVAEHEFMEKITGTYGKTWHTWHTDQQKDLPFGIPMLMMGFTQDGQADNQLIADRDKRFGVSSAENRKKRADIDYPTIDPSAEASQKGDTSSSRRNSRPWNERRTNALFASLSARRSIFCVPRLATTSETHWTSTCRHRHAKGQPQQV